MANVNEDALLDIASFADLRKAQLEREIAKHEMDQKLGYAILDEKDRSSDRSDKNLALHGEDVRNRAAAMLAERTENTRMVEALERIASALERNK